MINFNSRPRVGGDLTLSAARKRKSTAFQFTPPRGGRLVIYETPPVLFAFQFTPPRGGRRQGGRLLPAKHRISIHAPAWGATQARGLCLRRASIFQFTPPRGGRQLPRHSQFLTVLFQFTPPRGGRPRSMICPRSRLLFQFTPPRGGRRMVGSSAPTRSNFNSRPRVGGDPRPVCFKRYIQQISIHAPAWGATGAARP